MEGSTGSISHGENSEDHRVWMERELRDAIEYVLFSIALTALCGVGMYFVGLWWLGAG